MAGRLAQATSALKRHPSTSGVPLVSDGADRSARGIWRGGSCAQNNATRLIIAVMLVLAAFLIGSLAAVMDSKFSVGVAVLMLVVGLIDHILVSGALVKKKSCPPRP